MTGYADWVCRTVRDRSKMSTSWYQYAITQMDAVTAATDALNKHLGHFHICIKIHHSSTQTIILTLLNDVSV